MDRRIERNQISLTGYSVEVFPAFNALSLVLTNCSQLTPHTIKRPPPTPGWGGGSETGSGRQFTHGISFGVSSC